MTKSTSQIPANPIALLPFALFLLLFVGTGFFLSRQETAYAFYQLPAPVAILPAIILAIGLHPRPLTETINHFITGAGQNTILTMCLIYLLAGAFSAVAKATGGVEATVNLGLAFIPEPLIVPGMFVMSAFVATAMGTSMGTIAAIGPVALGVAESTDFSLGLMAGAVLSGAMFGDNLSIISDTTIAATRTQGCAMRDKFKANLHMALPAAFLVMALFFLLQPTSASVEVQESDWLLVLPYLMILMMAVAGWNVFAVLVVGLLSAGLIGFIVQEYELMQFGQDIYSGFTNMQAIFLLSMLIGGLSHLVKLQGGLSYITQFSQRLIHQFNHKRVSRQGGRATEFSLAGMVAATNCCTANNTVSIIVCGDVARELAQQQQVSPRRSASLLDIFSCINQGLIPWGAQALLLGSIFSLNPIEVVSHSYYAMLLAITALMSIYWKGRR